jgi:hypothetical protein
MVVVASSLMSLKQFVVFEGYEFSWLSSSTIMNTFVGPKKTMATRFYGQILHTLNLDFMFSFFKNCCTTLSTHFGNVTLFCSR